MHIPHLAPDKAAKLEASTALVLTPELILLELLVPQALVLTPELILLELLVPQESPVAIGGWGLNRIFDDDLQTSKLIVKLHCLNLVLHHLDGLGF